MKQYAGLTLLELLLTIAIVAVMFTMGLRVYYMLRADSDIRQVQANVDALFQAMGLYYRVNCYGSFQPGGVIQYGTLNPNYIPAPPAIKSINITTDLITPGYLTLALVNSPLVIASGAGTTNGYVTQFNRTLQTRVVCMAGVNATSPSSPNCVSTTSVGQVMSWSAQVSVQVKDNATALRLRQMMAADCTSSLSGSTVNSCSSNQPGPFVVWERNSSSSSAVKANGSTYWGTMQRIKQFNQMYTTYPINGLTSGVQTANQYYMCGN